MEVSCQLVTGPVYLAGETITCQVSVVNNAATTQVSAHWGSALDCSSQGFLKSRFQVLAWASASLHCFCTVSDSKVGSAVLHVSDRYVPYACRGQFSLHETLSVFTAIVCRLPFLTGRSLGSPAPRIHQIAHPFRLMDYQLSSDSIGLIVSVDSSIIFPTAVCWGGRPASSLNTNQDPLLRPDPCTWGEAGGRISGDNTSFCLAVLQGNFCQI